MTAIVGIYCQDGVVIGTDSSATFSQGQVRTIEQPTEKIHIIHNKIIVAGTGSVGLLQRHKQIIEDMWEKKEFSQQINENNIETNSPIKIGKQICQNTINDFASTVLFQSNSPAQLQLKFPFGSLVAFPYKNRKLLCEFEIETIQPEFKDERLWYCSLGSYQQITDSFLAFIRDVFWQNERPTLVEGIFATIMVLDHTINVNPGGVNGPVRIAKLYNIKNEIKAEMLDDNELLEQRQNIDEVYSLLRNWNRKLKKPSVARDVPLL